MGLILIWSIGLVGTLTLIWLNKKTGYPWHWYPVWALIICSLYTALATKG